MMSAHLLVVAHCSNVVVVAVLQIAVRQAQAVLVLAVVVAFWAVLHRVRQPQTRPAVVVAAQVQATTVAQAAAELFM